VLWVKFFSLDLLTALKLTTVLSLSVAQACAYYFARTFFTRHYSMLVALFYVGLPALPFLVLNRSLFANSFALSFVPIALRGAYDLLRGKRQKAGLKAFVLGLSSVILSHVITTYLCGIAISLLALICLPQVGWRGIYRLAVASCLVFSLTSFFLAPQFIELSWVSVVLQTARHDYRNYLLFATPIDSSQYRKDWALLNELASTATLAEIGLAVLCLMTCWQMLRWKERMALPMRFGGVLILFVLVISLPMTAFGWRWLPGLTFIQFPWRFLPFASLGVGLIVVAVRVAGSFYWRAYKPLARSFLITGLTLTALINLGVTLVSLHTVAAKLTNDQTRQILTSSVGVKLSMEGHVSQVMMTRIEMVNIEF
jgi:hypothetical protein